MAHGVARMMPARHVVVTGSNSGVGYWTALELARQGASVVLACRSAERAGQARTRMLSEVPTADITVMALDLADLDSVSAFADAYRDERPALDVLCNNAGLSLAPLTRTKQGYELQLGTNFLGHFALTGLMLPMLRKTAGARVVQTASQAHRFGKIDLVDPHYRTRRYNGLLAYGQSKLASLIFAFELQRRFEAAGIDAVSLAAHPGWAATNIGAGTTLAARRGGLALARVGDAVLGQSAQRGSEPIVLAATSPAVRGGQYYGPSGRLELKGSPTLVGSTRAAQNIEAGRRLWKFAEYETDIRYLS